MRFSILTRVCTLAIFAANFLVTGQAQDPGTGLIFAPQNVLEGVPLAHTPFAGAELPASVDLSAQMPPPGQQGRQNSCVGWTVAYALKSFHEHVEEKTPLHHAQTPNENGVFSPAFVYNQINKGQDNGALFVDALNVLSQRGAAKWADMPYSETDFTTQPSAAQLAGAKKYRIDIWRRVNVRDAKEVKAQLQMKYPVIVGAEVYSNFVSYAGGTPFRNQSGAPKGGHAMLVVGYDDTRSAFKLLNSWGTAWGDNGFGWIDYDCFTQIAREGYVAMDAKNGDGPLVRDITPQNPDQPLPTPPGPPAPPSVDARVAVEITNVQHNVPSPFGLGMRILGTVLIPPQHSGTAQVVALVYKPGDPLGNTTGAPVGSLMPMFASPHGQAGTTPGLVQVNNSGFHSTWQAFLPYAATNLPAGWQHNLPHPIQHNLVLQPVVYMNGFGIGEGALLKFFINK